MASLDRNLRRDLENAVKKARRIAEAGARQSLEQLAVHHHEPWGSLTPDQRKLRNRLRAHGRQLGDKRDEKKGTQSIERLVGECAYEHWHRLLFARFLAENELLVEPDSGMALSLDECRELAREQNGDWLGLASDFAQRMLPQIFRAGDPVLEVTLPPETRQELEEILEAQPTAVFTADDSLGWVYQFWQAEEKEEVNHSERKIGAAEIPAVTQLFTDDYMVQYLLHNTLGAWWASRWLRTHPEEARAMSSEDEVRAACSLPGLDWGYLRLVREQDDGQWFASAGAFDQWPDRAADIRLLDPCMGSGHFLVSALSILVSFRMAQEGIEESAAHEAVLSDNLFGLEIDPRCTQIAAFNLALAAWRVGGFRPLPSLNVACVGISPSAKKSDWLALANGDARIREGLATIYDLFEKAPLLGSLVDPSKQSGTLLASSFQDLRPLVQRALSHEERDDTAVEVAIAAAGVARAAELLAERFTLVVTNVPYLGRGKHSPELARYCEQHFGDAKSELATCILARSFGMASPGGTVAVVIKQDWLFLDSYRKLRTRLLREVEWGMVARLGPRAFESISGEVVNVALMTFRVHKPGPEHTFSAFDLSSAGGPTEKAQELRSRLLLTLGQQAQLTNPDARILLSSDRSIPLLRMCAEASHGQGTFDSPRFSFCFWELPEISGGWEAQQSTPPSTMPYGGCHYVLRWENGEGALAELMAAKARDGYSSGKWKAGVNEWGKPGVIVGQMGEFPAALYLGRAFDENASVVVPHDASDLPAVWAFLSSEDFRVALREVDQSIKVTCKTLVKVPFDRSEWRKAAATRFPNGLPRPASTSPTDWLFDGAPCSTDEYPLGVGVARLVSYEWPRQRGFELDGVHALGRDAVAESADEDGIVCLPALKGEPAAGERLQRLLARAYRADWSSGTLSRLLARENLPSGSLEDWLRNRFFEQHCEVFQQKPFIWHIWDGLSNGFAALVNYHKLAAPGGEGTRTLEKLIYSYLGDWIDRQRADQKQGVEGADARVAASEHLRGELEKILRGDPPFDLFVRWKPLAKQPIGWEPDVNDGVRVNIRPFMTAKPLNARAQNACILRISPRLNWKKDRGKAPSRSRESFPWFWGWDGQTEDFLGGPKFDGNRWNDLHYTRAAKLAARERAKAGGKS